MGETPIQSELNILADRVKNHSEIIATEEATKTSVVLPFLQALGYDVFNPDEVIPEFTADTLGKKGEKVDYAIRINGEIQILIECKGLSVNLDQRHLSQLFRYFTVTAAKFAILTNGRTFEVYSDLEEPNKLDIKPFFVFDLLDISARSISELEKFQKASFCVDSILATAERLKYVSSIKKYLRAMMDDPNAQFVKIVANEVHEGRLSRQIREQVEAAIKTAFRDLIREEIRSRLSSALASNNESEAELKGAPEIETTREEIEGMLTIRAIVREVIDSKRVDLRDAKSYCAVLVDDNNRKSLARLRFNRKKKYLGLFDGDTEDKVVIDGLDDIYNFSERLRETARKYL